MDLAALVRQLTRRRGSLPRASDLEGLGAAWAQAERALLPRVTASEARGAPLVKVFERLARRCGECEAIGRAARLRGSFLARHGRYASSLEAYERAAVHLSGTARDGARIGHAGSLLRLGRFRDAARLCRTVRRSAERRGDALLAAAAAFNLATALHESGDPERALASYRVAHEEFAAAGADLHAGLAAQNQANALVLLDRFDEASSRFDDAAERIAEAGDERSAARCQYNRGALLAATDRPGEADTALRESEARLRSAGAPHVAALARLDRADLLQRVRLLPEALHAVRGARRRMGRRVPPVERERARLIEARVLVGMGDSPAAARILRRPALLESPAVSAERLVLRAKIAATRNNAAEARALMEEAAGKHGTARPAARALCLTEAALHARALDDGRGARSLVAAARVEARRLKLPSLTHAIEATAFLVARSAGRMREADLALERALETLDAMRLRMPTSRLRAAALRGAGAWIAEAVRHRLERGDASQALALLERLRPAPGARTGAGDTETSERIRRRLARLERRLERDEGPAFLRSAQLDSSGTVRAIRSLERRLSDVDKTRTPPVPGPASDPALDVEDAFSRIPRSTAVVVLTGDAVSGLAIVHHRSRVEARAIPGHDAIATHVEELGFHLGRAALGPAVLARHAAMTHGAIDAILRALSGALLPRIGDLLRGARRLVVVPDGPWHAVPWGALPLDDRPIAASIPISLAPSVTRAVARPRAARGRPVVVAVPDERAPRIEAEARAVSAALGNATLLLDDAATVETVTALRRPRCLHVAAHGVYRSDAPEMSGLRLSDGWLRARDLARMDLTGSLVVLPGCDTGALHVHDGGEVEGLAHGVLASGAREAVLSLWHIPDAPTARFTERFHALRSRTSAATALARAQAEAAATGAPPWQWAGFVAWG